MMDKLYSLIYEKGWVTVATIVFFLIVALAAGSWEKGQTPKTIFVVIGLLLFFFVLFIAGWHYQKKK